MIFAPVSAGSVLPPDDLEISLPLLLSTVTVYVRESIVSGSPLTMYCTADEKSCITPEAGLQISVPSPSVISGAKRVEARFESSTPVILMVFALLSIAPV